MGSGVGMFLVLLMMRSMVKEASFLADWSSSRRLAFIASVFMAHWMEVRVVV